MNVKKNYKKGTRKEIIELLHMCGIIPEKSLRYLNHKNYKTMRMKISEMIKEGVVKYIKRDNLTRVIALSENSEEKEEYEKEIEECLLEYYKRYGKADIKRFSYAGRKGHVTDSDSHRVMYNADTMMFMYGAGIKILPTIKKDRVEKNIYLNSREIKNDIGYMAEKEKVDGEIKLHYSRLRGLYVTEKKCYAVYRTNTKATYKQNGEYKIKLYLDRLLINKLGRKEEVKEALLIVDENKREIVESIIKPSETDKRFSFTGMEFVYQKIYCLPASIEGQVMLKVFAHPRWNEKVIESFELPTSIGMESGMCDGYDEERYYYVFCVPDIKRFKKFVARAEIEDNRNRFVVICFDWQLELVKKVIGRYAIIKKVPFIDYIKEMKF